MEVISEIVVEVIETKKEEIIESLPPVVQEIIESLPNVVQEIIESKLVVDVVDGHVFSCSFLGWLFALRISRKSKPILPTKSEEIVKVDVVLPSPDSPAKEEVLPTVPQSE